MYYIRYGYLHRRYTEHGFDLTVLAHDRTGSIRICTPCELPAQLALCTPAGRDPHIWSRHV